MREVHRKNAGNKGRGDTPGSQASRLTDHELLSPGEERRLLEAVRADPDLVGGPARRARDVLVRKNLRLVADAAKRYYLPEGSALDRDDLFQAGVEGLMRAVQKFDPSRKTRFSTYAVPWIKQSIGRHIHNAARTVRLPVNMQNDLHKGRRARAALETAGLNPEAREVAEEAGVAFERLETVGRVEAATSTSSLDAPASRGADTRTSVADLVEDAGEDTAEQALEALDGPVLPVDTGPVLALLPAELRRIMELRCGFGTGDGESLTLAEVGKKMGMSHEAVRQRERLALEILRAELREEPGEAGSSGEDARAETTAETARAA